jgi:hypothetical protein
MKWKLKDINHLDQIIRMHINTSYFSETSRENVKIDFPKLTKNILTNRIFYGEYQLKMARNYFTDLEGITYILSSRGIQKLKKLKLDCFNNIINKV